MISLKRKYNSQTLVVPLINIGESANVIKVLLTITAFLVLMAGNSAIAHNKVGVIPMAGDDVPITDDTPARLTPTAPVTNADTKASDYSGRFIVTDRITGLQWQPINASPTPTIWEESGKLCEESVYLNADDWRLPTVRELQSIVDYGEVNSPVIVENLFPNTQGRYYWSASTYPAQQGSFVWAVDFANGKVRFFGKTNQGFTRCVR